MVNDATGEYLSEFDLRTYSDFGGSRAYISKQELAELKRCGTTSEPGLFLLGFKPLDALRPPSDAGLLLAPPLSAPPDTAPVPAISPSGSRSSVSLRSGISQKVSGTVSKGSSR